MPVFDCAGEDLKRLSISHGAKRVRYETYTVPVVKKIPLLTEAVHFLQQLLKVLRQSPKLSHPSTLFVFKIEIVPLGIFCRNQVLFLV